MTTTDTQDSAVAGQTAAPGIDAAIPPSGMDSAEILYADGTCNAIAQGMPRSEVLAEFKAVGDVYAQVTPMPSQRIAEIYVETAENTYC
ncbi:MULTISPECIES: hypothetical protein [Rhodococcus]|uniref:hypothetical protein n=1 Tax=Rhodococcus TaxID=1827 RepID=UPI001EF9E8EB|nr:MULTISPECIES: hypothetical protein [unclassified Rhodococcus (in: high G+C Gram-positive bacteria)]